MKVTFVRIGLLLELFDIPPPAVDAVFPLKVTFVRVGLLATLSIPPPW